MRLARQQRVQLRTEHDKAAKMMLVVNLYIGSSGSRLNLGPKRERIEPQDLVDALAICNNADNLHNFLRLVATIKEDAAGHFTLRSRMAFTVSTKSARFQKMSTRYFNARTLSHTPPHTKSLVLVFLKERSQAMASSSNFSGNVRQPSGLG